MANLDHIDPGNSGGSVVIPESGIKFIKREFVYECPSCSDTFKELDHLRRHKADNHPIKRPYLYIRGISSRKPEVTVRTKLDFIDIQFEDADQIRIDDMEFKSDIDRATEFLIKNQRGTHNVMLSNQGYPVEVRIRFEIMEPSVMERVERDFFSAFSNELQLAQQLQLFNEASSKFKSGISYAGPLGSYVTAVMTKDQVQGAALAHEHYVDKLGESLDGLYEFDRSLAGSILSVAAFMKNNFEECFSDNKMPCLKEAKRLFRTGLFYDDFKGQVGNSLIPIDNVSGKIIDFIVSSFEYRLANLPDMEKLSESSQTSMYDRIKIYFLLWIMARQTGNSIKASSLRSRLVHSNFFRDLVQQLEGASN